jgi:hypothetical protein
MNKNIPKRVLILETVSPDQLTILPSHSRKLSKKQVGRIAKSIERLGFLDPLLVDEAGGIICGACRWMAATELDLKAIPILRAGGLTDAEKRGFRIAENRLAEIGGWENELLLVELEILMDDGFDVLDIGFETADLDALFAGNDAPEEDDIAEPVPGVPVVSELGDLWRIGDQLLLCGDARNPVCYERLLGLEKAQMVFCDAPYNVKIGGNVSGLGKKVHGEFAMASGEMAEPEFTAFLREVFVQLVRFSGPASIHYQCMDWRHMVEIRAAAEGVYTELKNLVVWAKTNAGMSTFYRSQHELIFVFKSGEGTHVNNFGLGGKGRHRSNLWTYAGANVFSATRDKDLAVRATSQKPPDSQID